jgi:hypothetical protein
MNRSMACVLSILPRAFYYYRELFIPGSFAGPVKGENAARDSRSSYGWTGGGWPETIFRRLRY